MTKERPILWSFRRCPYAMRARLAIKSSGIKVELREILLREKPDAFLAASKTATVPVLVQNDGQVIEESLDIMFWALQSSGDPENWLSGWQEDEAGTTAFLKQLDGPFKSDLDSYKYATRYTDNNANAQQLAETHRQSAVVFLEQIEARLQQQSCLNGTEAGLIDYAVLPFIRQFRIADINWFDEQNWPALHAWLQRFLQSKRFENIMEKYTPWREDDALVIF